MLDLRGWGHGKIDKVRERAVRMVVEHGLGGSSNGLRKGLPGSGRGVWSRLLQAPQDKTTFSRPGFGSYPHTAARMIPPNCLAPPISLDSRLAKTMGPGERA
jgi:hypothetical protein